MTSINSPTCWTSADQNIKYSMKLSRNIWWINEPKTWLHNSVKNHSLYCRCRSQCKIFVKSSTMVYPKSQVMTVKDRNHAWDLKNSSHNLFLCLLKSQNSFYHTPASQLPACLPTTSVYVKHYYQLWRWSEYNDMSFFKDKMTTWQKSKASKTLT